MFSISRSKIIQRIALVLVLLPCSQYGYTVDVGAAVTAIDGSQSGSWRLRTSVFTIHYHPQPEHNNQQRLLSTEYVYSDDWLMGAAWFRNSFAQPTQYVYIGKDWWFWSRGNWQARVTVSAGFLHGYKGEYRDKIPLNQFGVSPAVLPYVGLSYKQSWFAEVHFFALAGAMATVGYRF